MHMPSAAALLQHCSRPFPASLRRVPVLACHFQYVVPAVQLHAEMQQSMQQLSAIQSELRGNINFMNPG